MNWDDVRTALAIERGGTLSAGARALGIDQTTASPRLARLERSLGARLFDRIDGRMEPTPAARRPHEGAAPMGNPAATVAEGVRDVDAALSGPVRLTSLPSFVTGYLAPRLAGFTGRHPGITVELVGASENLHLGRREADLAIRFSRPTAGAVLGRRIGAVGYAGYAAAAAFADAAAAPDRLPGAVYDDSLAHLPEQRWLDERVRPSRRAASATDALALLALVRHGAAAAMLPCFLADGDPALVRVTGAEPVCRRELWLLSHPELRAVRRIAALADWLMRTVERDRARLDGGAA